MVVCLIESLIVTILAASGDDGAPGNQARNNPNRCGYYPGFPASSQYVTAVGGTQVCRAMLNLICLNTGE